MGRLLSVATQAIENFISLFLDYKYNLPLGLYHKNHAVNVATNTIVKIIMKLAFRPKNTNKYPISG